MAKGYNSALLEQLSGKAGNVVFVQNRDGSVTIRPYNVPDDPQTPAQLQWRANIRAAGHAFNELTPAEYAEWQLYALDHLTLDPQTGLPNPPCPYNLYTTRAAKLLQVNPNATLPKLPPSEDFIGDSIALFLSSGTNEIIFTASGANASYIVTELLLQPLASPHRTPALHSYRSQAFVAFTSDNLAHTVTKETDWYSCAARFVHNQTGQSSALVEVGKLLVS